MFATRPINLNAQQLYLALGWMWWAYDKKTWTNECELVISSSYEIIIWVNEMWFL